MGDKIILESTPSGHSWFEEIWSRLTDGVMVGPDIFGEKVSLNDQGEIERRVVTNAEAYTHVGVDPGAPEGDRSVYDGVTFLRVSTNGAVSQAALAHAKETLTQAGDATTMASRLHRALWERDAALARVAELDKALDRELARVAAKDARIAELKTELAKRPAAFVDPDPPKPAHNPFREFGGDRRMVGR